MEIRFDAAQQSVAAHVRGPMMVYAGAGAGKTGIMAARFTGLVTAGAAAPSDVLAITFTREAASEMMHRVQAALAQDDVEGLNIGTIHALAYRLLRLGGTRRLSVAEPEHAYEFFQRAMLEVGLAPDKWDAHALFGMVSTLKENLVRAEDYQPVRGSLWQESLASVYKRYQALLGENGLVDFGDLILHAVEKLYSDPELLKYLQQLMRYVMVDEFQDTSPAQYELVRCLTNGHQNVLVASSPAQTIHEWRGVRYAELHQAFTGDFPQVPVCTLATNYRSAANIVAAARWLGLGYPDADQVAVRPAGEPIHLWRPSNQYEEAGRVAQQVHAWLEQGIPATQIAVLYRTHRQADLLESQLSASGLPYVILGAPRLYTRPEVQDVLAYLALALDLNAEGPLERVVNTPPRGLGPNSVLKLRGRHGVLTYAVLQAAISGAEGPIQPRVISAAADLLGQLDILSAKAAAGTPPAEMIDLVLEVTGYRAWTQDLLEGHSRLRALDQVRLDASGFDKLADFLQYGRARGADMTKEGVTLSTIHQAKGHEWQAVILVGAVEGVIPHVRSLRQAAEPEEERRLMYVALTRAKDRLVLSAPRRVTDKAESQPSRYLRRIPGDLLHP